MKRNVEFEKRLVEHCAPTMAGLKLGSLFCLQADAEEVEAWVAECNRELADRGLRLRLMRGSGCGRLVYVYREKMLAEALAKPEIRSFLQSYG